MRNFDYLREIEPLQDLRIYCEAAEAECRSKYDVSALNCRRALEWLVKTLYQLKNIELPERASLYELMTGAPFIEFVSDDRMMMAAHYIRVGDIMSEYDYYKTLDEDCFPDASGHRNRAELWDEIMSDTQLARVQNKMLLLNGEGKRTGIYANRYFGSDDSLRFQRSDDGRWTWFVEAQ